VTPAHDEPLEEQAARAQTNSGYARNGTLFPQVYRAAAPPVAQKKFAFHGFFFLFKSVFFSIRHHTQNVETSFKHVDDLKIVSTNLSAQHLEDRVLDHVNNIMREER